MKVVCLSIDLEVDWGRGDIFSSHDELKELLSLLDSFNIKATFFVSTESLGFGLSEADILDIYRRGHEIASHGHHHQKNSKTHEIQLEKDIALSKHKLESIIGKEVLGYRSPYLSNHKKLDEVLKKTKFSYNSSTGSILPSYKNFLNSFKSRSAFVVPISNLMYILPLSLTYIRLLSPILKYFPIGSGAMFMHLHEFKKENDTSLLGTILSINSGDKAFKILKQFILIHLNRVEFVRCCEYKDTKERTH